MTRLAILDTGQRRRARVAIRAVGLLSGHEPDDVAKTMLYRPDFFGRAWGLLLREVLRGPSSWTAGERELFGAFVSRQNACPFCVAVHTGLAGAEHAVPGDVAAALDAWRDDGLPQRLATTLAVLESVTTAPDDVPRAEVAAARAAGVTDAELTDALHVAFVFNAVNRLAHAFGYEWSSPEATAAGVAALRRFGYRVPGFLLR